MEGNSKEKNYKKKMTITAIVTFALIILLGVLTYMNACCEITRTIVNLCLAISFIFLGYYASIMQLEKGRNRIALATMFVTGYIFCRIIEVVINSIF